ncbi:MAG: chemotaxis-specific protein-glutamate methyltransferase CheB [Microcystaceae cyanobacterium]
MIKVLIVEDSPVAMTLLKRMVNETPDLQVVGTARTGVDAMDLIPKTKPNIICSDLYMPKMDGLELTMEVMSKFPTPILIISSSVQKKDTQQVFQLLNAGAVDVFPKPTAGLSSEYDATKARLIEKIRIVSGVKVFTKRRREKQPLVSQGVANSPTRFPPVAFKPDIDASIKVLAVGTSTGGPQALQELFSTFPPFIPVPVLCVQHISKGFLDGFVEWFNQSCPLPVEIAKHQEMPKPGVVYLPPDKQHLEIDRSGRFNCYISANVDGHCPSVTVLFNSVAKFYGRHAIAVLMTGMGRDGASGLLEIARKNGFTIAQDESTSVVFGMAHEAIKLGAANKILPIQEIAPVVLQRLKQ